MIAKILSIATIDVLPGTELSVKLKIMKNHSNKFGCSDDPYRTMFMVWVLFFRRRLCGISSLSVKNKFFEPLRHVTAFKFFNNQ